MLKGIDLVADERNVEEAMSLLEHVTSFKSYLMSNEDIKCIFKIGEVEYTVDFNIDCDEQIVSSSCSCGKSKCPHKALSYMLYNYSNHHNSANDETEELESQLDEYEKEDLVEMILDLYEDGKLSYDDILNEMDFIDSEYEDESSYEATLKDMKSTLSSICSFRNFKKGERNTDSYIVLMDSIIPSIVSLRVNAEEDGDESVMKMTSTALKKIVAYIGENAEGEEEFIQANLISSLLYILSNDEKCLKAVEAALKSSFNSSEYLIEHKKEMLELEIRRAKGSPLHKKLKNILKEI